MDQYALLTPEQFNICESPNQGDPNQGIFADNGYSPAGGPFLTEEFTDLYPVTLQAALILIPQKNIRRQLHKKKPTN